MGIVANEVQCDLCSMCLKIASVFDKWENTVMVPLQKAKGHKSRYKNKKQKTTR